MCDVPEPTPFHTSSYAVGSKSSYAVTPSNPPPAESKDILPIEPISTVCQAETKLSVCVAWLAPSWSVLTILAVPKPTSPSPEKLIAVLEPQGSPVVALPVPPFVVYVTSAVPVTVISTAFAEKATSDPAKAERPIFFKLFIF